MNQKLLINKKYFLVLIAGIFLFSCAGMNSTKDTRSINTSTGVIQGTYKKSSHFLGRYTICSTASWGPEMASSKIF